MARFASRLAAAALVLLSIGCTAPSSYEWNPLIQATTEYTPPPSTLDDPNSDRPQRPQRPTKWYVGQSSTLQPFDDVIGYGSAEVRAVVRDGVDPDRRSTAIARATQDRRGLDLHFITQTLRQRYFHAVLAESGAVLNLNIAPTQEFVLCCKPFRCRENDPPLRAPAEEFPEDRCNPLIVVGLDSTNRSCLFGQLADRRWVPIDDLLQGQWPGEGTHTGRMMIRSDSTHELLRIPPRGVLLRIRNDSETEFLRTFIVFRVFSSLDSDRDHALFTEAETESKQAQFWNNWRREWSRTESPYVRDETIGMQVTLMPPANAMLLRRGRPSD